MEKGYILSWFWSLGWKLKTLISKALERLKLGFTAYNSFECNFPFREWARARDLVTLRVSPHPLGVNAAAAWLVVNTKNMHTDWLGMVEFYGISLVGMPAFCFLWLIFAIL